jgi:threonine dehydrogenase-like Zn-dependent dehydrogenase
MSGALDSLNITFPAAGQVALTRDRVPPPGPGQVRCRALKSLLSRGTECFCLRGEYDPGTFWEEYIAYPFAPGYSMVGLVESVGDGVAHLAPGDRVTTWGPHRQVFLADQAEAFPVPDEINDVEATWATLARTTQLGVRRAGLELGESVGVIGLGILGQLVVQYLAISGARRIVAIDPSPGRLARAQSLGATHAIAATAADALPRVADLTEGRMLDVVFDITGHPAVLAPATQLLRKLGRLVLLGDSPTPSRQHLGPRVVGHSIAILGMHGFMFPEQATPFNQWTAAMMTEVFFDLLAQGRMNVAPLTDRLVSPEIAPTLYPALLAGEMADEIGQVFDWSILPA